MRSITLALLILTPLVFNGCTGKDQPEKIVEKKVYIKTECPKQVILNPIQGYKITDWVDLNSTHYAIKKDQFINFSNTCYTMSKHLEFYEKDR